MSWGTCYGASNNIHFDSPPLMSDGRNFATWIPACKVNDNIRKSSGIKSNYEYRRYLTQNADNIIKQNQKLACDGCCACWEQYNHIPFTPKSQYLYKSCTSGGQPYGYEHSNLKNIYLSRFALQSRKVAPILTQQQYLLSDGRK